MKLLSSSRMEKLEQRIENGLRKFANEVRKIKRLPPILFPVVLVALAIVALYRTTLWLFGFWNCSDCGKRGDIRDDKIEVKELKSFTFGKNQYHYYKKRYICDNCQETKYKNNEGIK